VTDHKVELERPLTVGQLKRMAKGKKLINLQKEPRKGTRLREIFDLFIKNPGEPVLFSLDKSTTQAVTQLRLFYELDLRCIRQGGSVRGKSIWMLVGYWKSKDYIDLTIPQSQGSPDQSHQPHD
jgi:hypothetical protein